jgi:uncharacterized OB-fold protein
LIEGSECKCGFKTVSKEADCPRCGKRMSPRIFFDEGKVLSYVKLDVPPEHTETPMDLVMVEIDNGPKIVCWADFPLKADQRVKIVSERGILVCRSP